MEMSGTTCTRSLRNLRQKDVPNYYSSAQKELGLQAERTKTPEQKANFHNIQHFTSVCSEIFCSTEESNPMRSMSQVCWSHLLQVTAPYRQSN